MANATGVKPQNYDSIRTPLHDTLGAMGHCQHNRECRELELNLVDCTDVFGTKGILKQCRDEFDDYQECLLSYRQLARTEAMQKERWRQYMAGQRTRKDLYAVPPKLDSFHPTYYQDIG